MDENSIFGAYSKDIARNGKILSTAEQRKLAESIMSNNLISEIYTKSLMDNKITDETRNRLELEHREIEDQIYSARKILTVTNLPFVISRARKYMLGNVEISDLIQDGSLAIFEKATKKYNPYHDSGSNFLTYAGSWADQGITRGISLKSKTIRRPVHVKGLENKINKFINNFNLENPKNPSSEEISKGTQIELRKVDEIKNNVALSSVVSLDYAENPGDSPLLDTISYDLVSEMNGNFNSDNKMVIDNLFVEAELTGRQMQVIGCRFGLETGMPMTLEEIGIEVGLTRERIRQIETKALKKLNKAAQRLNLNFEDIF
jgi:RNA polymerase primary sigma factor